MGATRPDVVRYISVLGPGLVSWEPYRGEIIRLRTRDIELGLSGVEELSVALGPLDRLSLPAASVGSQFSFRHRQQTGRLGVRVGFPDMEMLT